jgi:hypothetical protein
LLLRPRTLAAAAARKHGQAMVGSSGLGAQGARSSEA